MSDTQEATSPPLEAHSDAPGPITLSQRAFFDAPPAKERSGARPLVPLATLRPSERVEMSGGVIVIERTSPAWIATGVAVLLGLVGALVLGLDAADARAALVASEASAAELSQRLAAAEAPRAADPVATAAPALGAGDGSDARLVDALRVRLAKEVAAGDASVAADGGAVTVTLEAGVLLDKKGRLTRDAADVLARVGAALGAQAERVDVAAWYDGRLRRGASAWGQSAVRATTVARALVAHSRVAPAAISVVGRGGARGAAGRRVQLVIGAR